MWKKPQRKFTYLDWLKFIKYDPEARKIQRRYKKKLAKLKGVDFMTCQGEMFRELGRSYRELRDQRDKSRRESHSAKLKSIAERQATRAEAGRKIRRG